VRCQLCGEQVYNRDPDAVPRTINGDADCPAPYWLVAMGKRAVRTFIGDGAEGRAKGYAKPRPGFRARRIAPHGHQAK
jgi:hypothetical protein